MKWIFVISSVLLSLVSNTGFAQSVKQPAGIMYAGTSPGNNSRGIYVLHFDRNTKKLSELRTVYEKRNPNFLALHPKGKYLYAIYSEGMSDVDKRGTVMSFTIDPVTGFIKKLNEQSAEGRGPAHVSVDPKGRFVYVANYGQGNFAIYRIGADGKLSPAQQVVQFEGGSNVDTSRQKHPFIHSVIPSSDGKFIYASSLGSDKIFIYEVKSAGDFVPASTPFASSTPGSGPRHFIIHPNSRFAYSIEEITSSVASYRRDRSTGALTPIERFLPVPDTFKARTSGADIHFSPDAKFLYASIRGLNNIAIYSVNRNNGKLKFVGLEDGRGDHPRNFCVDKKGEYVFVENMRSNNIAIFKRDKKSGKMEFIREEMIPGVACLIQW
jgi:6-phosphogluconolactonase